MVASPGSGDINHLLNSATTDPRIETHIGKGSSGLAEFLENDTKIEESIEVQCVPIYTVLRSMGRSHVDFFSLDVERAEMGILDTIPWDKLSFTILAIEHPTKDDLAAYLDERGYRHVASKDGDHIFLNKADLKLK